MLSYYLSPSYFLNLVESVAYFFVASYFSDFGESVCMPFFASMPSFASTPSVRHEKYHSTLTGQTHHLPKGIEVMDFYYF